MNMCDIAQHYMLQALAGKMGTGLMERNNTESPVWHVFAFEADANGKLKDIDASCVFYF